MATGIYAIVNKVNSKRYFGSAIDIHRRFRKHKCSLIRRDHHSPKLQRAWNKYGQEAFEFRIILICSHENLLQYEQLIIDTYRAVKNGYNISPFAGSRKGVPHSIKTRQKMKESANSISPEVRAKMAISRIGSKRQPHSKETRDKIGIAHRGRTLSAEHCLKIGKAHIGIKKKPCSEETKAKISAAMKALHNH